MRKKVYGMGAGGAVVCIGGVGCLRFMDWEWGFEVTR